jgi:hypothetical protein
VYDGFDGHAAIGELDVAVIKYDNQGTQRWSRLLGAGQDDWGYGVATDADRNVYVAGYRYPELPARPDGVLLLTLDADGNER